MNLITTPITGSLYDPNTARVVSIRREPINVTQKKNTKLDT